MRDWPVKQYWSDLVSSPYPDECRPIVLSILHPVGRNCRQSLLEETTLVVLPGFGGVVYKVHVSLCGQECTGVVIVADRTGVEKW